MTAAEVQTCFLSNHPSPSNPNGIVPAWVGTNGLDGMPPPPFPTFTSDGDAYQWIADHWTEKNPCS